MAWGEHNTQRDATGGGSHWVAVFESKALPPQREPLAKFSGAGGRAIGRASGWASELILCCRLVLVAAGQALTVTEIELAVSYVALRVAHAVPLHVWKAPGGASVLACSTTARNVVQKQSAAGRV